MVLVFVTLAVRKKVNDFLFMVTGGRAQQIGNCEQYIQLKAQARTRKREMATPEDGGSKRKHSIDECKYPQTHIPEYIAFLALILPHISADAHSEIVCYFRRQFGRKFRQKRISKLFAVFAGNSAADSRRRALRNCLQFLQTILPQISVDA